MHALATKRKQLTEAGDVKGLTSLPNVTVYEKAAAPGGVWRSNRNDDGTDNSNGSTNMYDGLWINGHKDGMEYFDYTFQDHFKTPQPVYLPRQQILEYVMARVTLHEDIFKHVNFNTEVKSITYDEEEEQFIIETENEKGMETTEQFDKCIWAAGLNGKPRMIPEILEKLSTFKGQIVHSTEMGKLSTDDTNAVKGKHILMVGDSYSAEDLALQCLKLGAEKISIVSRSGKGAASYVYSWPGNKVDVQKYANVAGVKDDELGTTITLDAVYDSCPVTDVEDVSIIIFCTGYELNGDFLPHDLRPFCTKSEESKWQLEDIGIDSTKWRMCQNPFTRDLGNVEPSSNLATDNDMEFLPKLYRNSLLISNPRMMFIFETSYYPLLQIDVSSWTCLAHLTGELLIPTEEEMKERNLADLMAGMNDPWKRYELDPNYKKAYDEIIDANKDHWYHHHTSNEYHNSFLELNSFWIWMMARDMKEANYPLQFGEFQRLNKIGNELLRMYFCDCKERYDLGLCDDETKRWKTFRDADPSQFRSYITGMGSAPLKGKWLEIDDEGNVPNHGNVGELSYKLQRIV